MPVNFNLHVSSVGSTPERIQSFGSGTNGSSTHSHKVVPVLGVHDPGARSLTGYAWAPGPSDGEMLAEGDVDPDGLIELDGLTELDGLWLSDAEADGLVELDGDLLRELDAEGLIELDGLIL
jgi:hypothetical protein